MTATRYTLKMLIHEAYGIEDYKILGWSAWVVGSRPCSHRLEAVQDLLALASVTHDVLVIDDCQR